MINLIIYISLFTCSIFSYAQKTGNEYTNKDELKKVTKAYKEKKNDLEPLKKHLKRKINYDFNIAQIKI
ncbi:MAG: hypothetical protein P8P15_03255 [Polaribacter sp.]|nr:hypothetical protein [Polaribacter sp.]